METEDKQDGKQDNLGLGLLNFLVQKKCDILNPQLVDGFFTTKVVVEMKHLLSSSSFTAPDIKQEFLHLPINFVPREYFSLGGQKGIHKGLREFMASTEKSSWTESKTATTKTVPKFCQVACSLLSSPNLILQNNGSHSSAAIFGKAKSPNGNYKKNDFWSHCAGVPPIEIENFTIPENNGQRQYGVSLRFFEPLTIGEWNDILFTIHRALAEDGTISKDKNTTAKGKRNRMSDTQRRKLSAWYNLLRCQARSAEESVSKHGNYTIYVPRTLTILSHYPYLTTWRLFLIQLFRLALSPEKTKLKKKNTITYNNLPTPESFIRNFCGEIPLPPRGLTRVDCFLANDKNCPLSLSRPCRNSLHLIDFDSLRCLFALVSLRGIILLWTMLMVESRVLITVSSRGTSLLLPVMNALNSLLFPLKWQGVFIPMLPKAARETILAPVPYLIGVDKELISDLLLDGTLDPYSSTTSSQNLPLVILDLDSGYIQLPLHKPEWSSALKTIPFRADLTTEEKIHRIQKIQSNIIACFPSLPHKEYQKLVKALTTLVPSIRTKESMNPSSTSQDTPKNHSNHPTIAGDVQKSDNFTDQFIAPFMHDVMNNSSSNNTSGHHPLKPVSFFSSLAILGEKDMEDELFKRLVQGTSKDEKKFINSGLKLKQQSSEKTTKRKSKTLLQGRLPAWASGKKTTTKNENIISDNINRINNKGDLSGTTSSTSDVRKRNNSNPQPKRKTSTGADTAFTEARLLLESEETEVNNKGMVQASSESKKTASSTEERPTASFHVDGLGYDLGCLSVEENRELWHRWTMLCNVYYTSNVDKTLLCNVRDIIQNSTQTKVHDNIPDTAIGTNTDCEHGEKDTSVNKISPELGDLSGDQTPRPNPETKGISSEEGQHASLDPKGVDLVDSDGSRHVTTSSLQNEVSKTNKKKNIWLTLNISDRLKTRVIMLASANLACPSFVTIEHSCRAFLSEQGLWIGNDSSQSKGLSATEPNPKLVNNEVNFEERRENKQDHSNENINESNDEEQVNKNIVVTQSGRNKTGLLERQLLKMERIDAGNEHECGWFRSLEFYSNTSDDCEESAGTVFNVPFKDLSMANTSVREASKHVPSRHKNTEDAMFAIPSKDIPSRHDAKDAAAGDAIATKKISLTNDKIPAEMNCTREEELGNKEDTKSRMKEPKLVSSEHGHSEQCAQDESNFSAPIPTLSLSTKQIASSGIALATKLTTKTATSPINIISPLQRRSWFFPSAFGPKKSSTSGNKNTGSVLLPGSDILQLDSEEHRNSSELMVDLGLGNFVKGNDGSVNSTNYTRNLPVTYRSYQDSRRHSFQIYSPRNKRLSSSSMSSSMSGGDLSRYQQDAENQSRRVEKPLLPKQKWAEKSVLVRENLISAGPHQRMRYSTYVCSSLCGRVVSALREAAIMRLSQTQGLQPEQFDFQPGQLDLHSDKKLMIEWYGSIANFLETTDVSTSALRYINTVVSQTLVADHHIATIRKAFLRALTSLLRNFRSFLDVEMISASSVGGVETFRSRSNRHCFNASGFIKDIQKRSTLWENRHRRFVDALLFSQTWERFLENRINEVALRLILEKHNNENENGLKGGKLGNNDGSTLLPGLVGSTDFEEVRFFDETISKKLNRSFFNPTPKPTPFLSSKSQQVNKIFNPPSAIAQGFAFTPLQVQMRSEETATSLLFPQLHETEMQWVRPSALMFDIYSGSNEVDIESLTTTVQQLCKVGGENVNPQCRKVAFTVAFTSSQKIQRLWRARMKRISMAKRLEEEKRERERKEILERQQKDEKMKMKHPLELGQHGDPNDSRDQNEEYRHKSTITTKAADGCCSIM
eukprot:g1997.t1